MQFSRLVYERWEATCIIHHGGKEEGGLLMEKGWTQWWWWWGGQTWHRLLTSDDDYDRDKVRNQNARKYYTVQTNKQTNFSSQSRAPLGVPSMSLSCIMHLLSMLCSTHPPMCIYHILRISAVLYQKEGFTVLHNVYLTQCISALSCIIESTSWSPTRWNI